VVLDRFMRDRVLAKGIAPEKVSVISPWSQDERVHFDEAGRETFRKQHGFTDKFMVMHAGNHSPCHPLTTLLAAAEQLRDRADIVFCFQGGGSELAKVRDFVDARKLGNVLCLPYQPPEQLAASLSAADLHVVVMGEPFVGTIHPCKIYNAFKVGAPIAYIGPEESHVVDLMRAAAMQTPHISVRHGEADKLAAAILRMMPPRPRLSPGEVTWVDHTCSRATLLPQMVTAAEI
jgi:hypothetical protein